MVIENRYFTIHEQKPGKPGIAPVRGVNKYTNFLGINHLFSNQKIWFPNEMKHEFLIQEAMNEIRGVSKTNTGKRIGSAKHDDVIDCMAQLQHLNIIKPSEEKEFRPNEETGVYELVEIDHDDDFGGSSYVF